VAPNGAVFSFFFLFRSRVSVHCLRRKRQSMTHQQPIQPVAALAQMMAEVAAMHREQAAINQQNLQQLHMQAARQTQVLEGLLLRSETASEHH